MVESDDTLTTWLYSGGSVAKVVKGSIIDTGWHHIALTYNQSSGSVKLYIDGTLDTASIFSGVIDINTKPVYIGMASSVWAKPGYFDGIIDDITT